MAGHTTVLVLAAGHGTRMRSTLPKVLHPLCGRPMVEWAIEAARGAGAARIVCVVRSGDGVGDALPGDVEAVEQREGEGTGSAALAARSELEGADTVVILSGDQPLISSEVVGEMLETHAGSEASATVLTTDRLDPAGYGRIVRAGDGSIERIVETKRVEGVAPEVLGIREINLGTYAFSGGQLLDALDAVGQEGGERYLTAVFPLLRERGRRISAQPTDDVSVAVGVNTRADLMAAERLARERLLEQHARAGVTFTAPDSVAIEVGVEIGEDTTIETGVTLRAGARVGARCSVGPHTTLLGATLGDGVSVPHSYLVECEVADGASVGPFAYLRPGAVIGEGAKVGTFVEVKNSEIGAGAKVPHLSYIGDADVGEGANVAAGNITANYDGRRKHRTVIGKNVKTGVDTSFVAPVRVGDSAYTGAGSVITDDVPDGALGIARSRQQNVEGYSERVEEDEAE